MFHCSNLINQSLSLILLHYSNNIMQQITQCKYYSFVWAPIRLGPRATSPPLNPPLRQICEKISKTRTCPSQAKNISTCQKSALGVPVSSINSVHINIYIHTYIHFNRVLIIYIYIYFNCVLIV